ncbi:hypothetical protein WJ74_33770 [Burkholderia ubonensis]|uniref:hypothetical protein n=1 Tax=Burkholderia ubonensis TaxID=101571 RepID=UPI0007538594|nr:hypothetical protein [Burkholderia ubonensis]KVO23400.1 hypothetical protein WJ74_33770 [Burkholderia ubonensis]
MQIQSTSSNGGLYEIMQVLNKINENAREGLLAKANAIDAKGENASQEDMMQLQIAADTYKNITSGTQGLFDQVRSAQAKAAESVRI